jgi:N,N-dimethylformamidase beta subunit-like protein
VRNKTLMVLSTVALFFFCTGVTLPAVAAAVAPSAGFAASTKVESTPDQTFMYAITITRSGTFSRLVLPLPAYASKSGRSVSASNITNRSLESVRGGYVLRTTKPFAVSAGKRLWVMINGLRTPPASTTAVTITALSTGNAVLAKGTAPALTFSAVTPCPAVWPQNYVATENRLAGTTAWRLSATAYDSTVASGFASQTSAKCGDTVTLRVTSNDYQLAVTVYRMGYYGGAGARAVWASRTAIRGFGQPAMEMVKTDPQGRTISMPTGRKWTHTFSVRIDGNFRPGDYLVKITGVTSKKGSYVPLIVRDDAGAHDKLVLNSVATWQAYNNYGGASAYTSPVTSTRVSYDRPLVQNQGTGDFLSLEFGFVYWAEKQGLDLNYAADTDLHTRPYLVDAANTMVLMPHTEYWSTAMRSTTDASVANGMNLASFGGNQIYWRINPGPSALTGAGREYEIFRTGDTGRFRDAPNAHPEQSLLGAMYGCLHMNGTATPNATWLWEGVSTTAIPHLAAGEVDHVQDGFAKPAGLDVLTTIPLDTCNRADNPWADVVAVDDGTGGRVFNASTHSWICMLYGQCPWSEWSPTPTAPIQVGQATMNVFSWLDSGTAVADRRRSGPEDPLAVFERQRIGTLMPSSGLPPLEPPVEG